MGIIVSEENSKTVVRVERWKQRIVMAWLMIRKEMMCVMSVYGHRRMEAEKEEVIDALERMVGFVELDMMLCIAGDSSAHVGAVEPGEEGIVGRYGWNSKGRGMLELVAINWLAVLSSRSERTTRSHTGVDSTRQN